VLTIDGSFGEGGGQILRTALALSTVTGTAFRIERIRAAREWPGLLRQHLTAVNAAAAISGAAVEGAVLGSTALTFNPGPVRGGDFEFAVGTAGSATLVLQTVLPALLTASAPSGLTLEGGTHNPAAPPFDFLAKSFLPLINRMGPAITAELERPGFYPAGGGLFRVEIKPAPRLLPFELMERTPVRVIRVRAIVANLPRSIAQREINVVRRALSLGPDNAAVEEIRGAPGPGNAIMIEIEMEHHTEVFTGFGAPGVRAEAVADDAAKAARAYIASGAPVGHYLADQLLVPFALAGGGRFRTGPLSRHAATNIEVIRDFLKVNIGAMEEPGGTWTITVG
jgi:RNA 3'-terminal phosphate cyclase (ATP)